MLSETALNNYRLITLEAERDEISPEYYVELEAMRAEWRASGDDMLTIVWPDGVSHLARLSRQGEPPSLDRLSALYQRATTPDPLVDWPIGGTA